MEKANNHEMGNSLFNILYKTTTLSNICGTFVRKSRELYFNKTPTSKSANPDLIVQCIEEKKRHNSAGVKIVQSAGINKSTDYRSFA